MSTPTDDLVKRLERATSGEHHEDYSAQDYLDLCRDSLAALASLPAPQGEQQSDEQIIAAQGASQAPRAWEGPAGQLIPHEFYTPMAAAYPDKAVGYVPLYRATSKEQP